MKNEQDHHFSSFCCIGFIKSNKFAPIIDKTQKQERKTKFSFI
jgi:hypothetical protein